MKTSQTLRILNKQLRQWYNVADYQYLPLESQTYRVGYQLS